MHLNNEWKAIEMCHWLNPVMPNRGFCTHDVQASRQLRRLISVAILPNASKDVSLVVIHWRNSGRIERRNAHGIQSAHGWFQWNCRWDSKGSYEILSWPWGFWGQLGGSPEWWLNGHTFWWCIKARCLNAPLKRLSENFAVQHLKLSASERDATGERQCLPCQDRRWARKWYIL